jgi:hypothetical protein
MKINEKKRQRQCGTDIRLTRTVYCVKTNTADTEAKHTNTLTKKIFQKVPSFWHSNRVGFIKQNVLG